MVSKMARSQKRQAAKDSNRPTHLLKMKSRDDSDGPWVRMGVGWENNKGNVTLSLNMGVVLNWRDKEDYILILVPNNE